MALVALVDGIIGGLFEAASNRGLEDTSLTSAHALHTR